MKSQTFENWLQEWHAEKVDEGSCNGEMMAEAYERWIENLEIDTLIELGDVAMKTARLEGLREAREIMDKHI